MQLLRHSKCSSAYALGRTIAGHFGETDIGSHEKYARYFNRYLAGSAIRNRQFIDNINNRYWENGHQVFDNVFWYYLSQPPQSQRELSNILKQLDGDLRTRVANKQGESLKAHINMRSIHFIASKGTLSSLACCLLVAQHLRMENRIYDYCQAKSAIQKNFILLLLDPAFFVISDRVREFLIHHVFSTSNADEDNPVYEILPQSSLDFDIHLMRGFVFSIAWHATRSGLITETQCSRFLYIALTNNSYQILKQLEQADSQGNKNGSLPLELAQAISKCKNHKSSPC